MERIFRASYELLQWGRACEGAETRRAASLKPSMERFNGAAPVRARRLQQRYLRLQSYCRFNGAAPVRARRLLIQNPNLIGVYASMGPRL